MLNREQVTQEQTAQSSLLTPQHLPTTWVANIRVTLKPVVNDPPGLAMRDALHNLGYSGVQQVRSGKYIQVTLESASHEEAEKAVHQMCRHLLANPVIEDYTFDVQAQSK